SRHASRLKFASSPPRCSAGLSGPASEFEPIIIMPRYDCVAISGVGLIGGSVGLAMREKKLAGEIVGFGSRPATLEAALARGAITRVAADAQSAVAAAQVVIVC